VTTLTRRGFLLAASAGLASLALPSFAAQKTLARLPVQQAGAETISFGYHSAGPEEGRPVVLLHDFAYDIHSYAEVVPLLAAQGFRVIVPYLRGHGTTRFIDRSLSHSGEPAALGSDVITVIDALHIPEAVIAGFGWGAHAARAFAALKPTRCVGLVTVDGFAAATAVDRAAAGAARRAAAHKLWQANSPAWRFDEAIFARSAKALDNPDFAAVIGHAYRYQRGETEGLPQYDSARQKLAASTGITAPAITLEGSASGIPLLSEPGAGFSGPHSHRRIEGAGHNLPLEAPKAFADAVAELVRNGKWRT